MAFRFGPEGLNLNLLTSPMGDRFSYERGILLELVDKGFEALKGGLPMTATAVENRIKNEVKALKPPLIAKLYDPNYYLHDVLKYVFEHHISSTCIHVQLAEMLFSINQKTGDRLAGMLADCLMVRTAMIFKSEPQVMYINDTVNFIKQYIKMNYSYIDVDISGRIKALYSFLIKALENLTEYLILEDIDIIKIFTTDEDCKIAKNIIEEMQEDLLLSTTRDTYGIRFIIYSYNRSRDEDILEPFCFEFSADIKKILQKKGFTIEKTTDYISNPKGSYKSYQWKAVSPGISLECQVRTERMHEEAEHGKASHLNYKENKRLYKHYKTFIKNLSEESGNAGLHGRTCILQEQNLNRNFVSNAINEIPEKLTGFSNQQVIDDILAKPGIII